MEKDRDFIEQYEETMFKIALILSIDEGLAKELKNKREFGLEKYKDKSFQISKENAINVNIKKHAKEEVVDLLNYLLHMAVVRNLNKKSLLSGDLDKAIVMAKNLYYLIDDIKLEDSN
mgnify:CR=1 FL=1|jgi:serine protease inhibitor